MPSDELNDEESTLFLKIVRNNKRGNVKRLVIKDKTVEIVFTEESALPPYEDSKETVMGWKDKDWQDFFEKNEPLI